VDTPATVARLVTGAGAPPSAEVVVHRGDSLWSIARRHLGAGATDTEVAAAWPHWYAANRDVIGPDPDLLLPGQVLHAPVGTHP
jgi:nucleoid-associated protein YgaU